MIEEKRWGDIGWEYGKSVGWLKKLGGVVVG